MLLKLKKSRFLNCFWLLCLLLLVIAGCAGSGSDGTNTARVVVFSDVHFTPYDDPQIFPELVAAEADQWPAIFERSSVTTMGTWGDESNYNLLVSALDAVNQHAVDDAVVIFTGDMLAHHFSDNFYKLYGSQDETAFQAFVLKTVTFFTHQLRERFGDQPVVFTLGNNDSYAGDYAIKPGGRFLADTSGLFYHALLEDSAQPNQFMQSYQAGGYFSANPDGSKIQFISLNTVMFSNHWPETASGYSEQDAWDQLAWLDITLAAAAARQHSVWLIMHIPPGADIYKTVKTYMDDTGHVSDGAIMWREKYQTRFLEIIAPYGDTIQFGLAGHTHMDEYRLWYPGDNTPARPFVVTPSISPVFGNNPGFKVLTIAPDNWQVLDYTASICPLENPEPAFAVSYSFLQTYMLQMPLFAALDTLYSNLASNTDDAHTFIGHYYSGHHAANPISDINWPAYRCGIGQMEKPAYVNCVNSPTTE